MREVSVRGQKLLSAIIVERFGTGAMLVHVSLLVYESIVACEATSVQCENCCWGAESVPCSQTLRPVTHQADS